MTRFVMEPDQIFAFVGEDTHKGATQDAGRDAMAFTPKGYGPEDLRWDNILMSSLEDLAGKADER